MGIFGYRFHNLEILFDCIICNYQMNIICIEQGKLVRYLSEHRREEN